MNLTFEQWMNKVNEFIIAKIGFSADDLSDNCYADWFEDGISPRKAASMAIKAETDGIGSL